MAALAHQIERPAYVEAPAAGQLSLVGAPAAPREREPVLRSVPLSEQLRREQTAEREATMWSSRTTVLRRGGEATLDEMLVGAWEGLSVHHPVACPVCSGAMVPREVAAGGACRDCGVQLR